MRLVVLFFELFKISLFVIGGGYAILAVADDVFAKRGWTKEGELLDQLPIFQMVPGLIATHTAVYVGRKVAGAVGAVIGVIAVASPSVGIFTLVSAGYSSLPLDNPWLGSAFVGLRSALTGIIAATIVRGWTRSLKDAFAYSVLVCSLVALVAGVGVPYVLLGGMLVGVATCLGAAPREGAHGETKVFRASWLPLLLFLKYGALCFGGGFVLVPMYIEDFVGPTATWLQATEEEFSTVMAITQMTPGPIGVNGATYFGYRLAGVLGALLASAALLLPGSLLAYLAFASLDRFKTNRIVQGLLRGVKPASVALMLVALAAFARMSFWSEKFNTLALLIAIICTLMTLKKKLNVVLLIVLSAFAASALRAEGSITLNEYPNADAVLVDDISRVHYNPNGTSEESSESWVKILTEKGRREESTLSLRYSRRYGAARIVYVGAIDENGIEREIDVSATTNESTDNSSMGMNIYDPLERNIVCTIPGLKVGETIHTKILRHTSQPRCEGIWSDTSVFEYTVPIVRSSLEIIAPKERPLKKIAIRHPLGNIVQSSRECADGSIVHSFVCTNSPQAFAEPDMPPMYTQVQHLRVSTAESWPEISKWYWNLSLPHLAKTTEAMTNLVNEITAASPDAMRAIFKFVSQEVRYMGLTLEDTSPGYAPHDVNITFDNRYGVCRDKAGLLVALLRIAGFEAYPTLIHVAEKHDPDVPQPFFNHAIVAVAVQGPTKGVELAPSSRSNTGYILMDPTNENAKDLFPAYESDKSFLVCRPDGEDLAVTPTPSPEHNALRVESRAQLQKDGSMFLENDIRFGGVNDTIYRSSLVKQTPEDRVKFFERVVRRLAPGAELIKCIVEPIDMRDTETPIRVSIASKLPEMVLHGETRNEIVMPYVSRTLGLANFLLQGNTSLEKRRFALQLDATACVDEHLEIKLDDSFGETETLPPELKIKSGYEYSNVFEVTNSLLRSHRRVAISKIEFTPEEYADLREDIKRVEAVERKRPVFAEDRLSEADIHWLERSTTVDIASDRAWVVTNVVEKAVLSYEGKKSAAEMKLAYNPAVETVELVSAVVSNRDGTVTAVSDREMNVMDCGWAAAAPRYPASKLLVVNLPTVEIGSTIACTFVRTVTNAPTSYYGVFSFDSYDPLDYRKVRVDDWMREVRYPTRLRKEPGQPMAALWRDQEIVSRNTLEATLPTLRTALAVDAVDPYRIVRGKIRGWNPFADDWAMPSIREIRDWMAMHVRIAGPSVWELPFDLHCTDPSTVLKERYGSRLDYVRTLAALLKGAGYHADVVLAADDADDPERLKELFMHRHLNLRAFAWPLCRVRVSEGGCLGIGGEETTYFLGTENEYTPIEVSSMVGSDFIDPETGAFGVVTVPDAEFLSASEEAGDIHVRENGAVDIRIQSKLYGTAVGGFRKQYAEILPEDRSRLYQTILGSVSQAASATSELETDIESYPATRSFSCYVPDYATVDGDTITLQLPTLISTIPSFTGCARKTPFAVAATDREFERMTVTFPEGYTEVEHLPESFRFGNPYDQEYLWLQSKVTSEVVDDRLVVTIERKVGDRGYTWFLPDFIELIKERSRIASARANRTIVVRRAGSRTGAIRTRGKEETR